MEVKRNGTDYYIKNGDKNLQISSGLAMSLYNNILNGTSDNLINHNSYYVINYQSYGYFIDFYLVYEDSSFVFENRFFVHKENSAQFLICLLNIENYQIFIKNYREA